MERRSRVHLDHPTIRGRVRGPQLRHAQAQSSTDLQHHQPSRDSQVTPPAPPVSPSTPPKATPVQQQPIQTQKQPEQDKGPQVLRIRTSAIDRKPQTSAHLPRQARSGVLRRQMVRLTKPYQVKKHRSFKPYLVVGFSSFLVVAFGLGIFTGYKRFEASSQAEPSAVLAKQTTQTESRDKGTTATDMPTENNAPSNISSYTVSSNLPRFLSITKLGVNARVRRVGTDADNTIKGPSNIFDVGWYENSAEPGKDGTVLIDGHTSGETKRGVFYGLNTLKKGDKVDVERGDGKHLTYTVATTELTDFDVLDQKKVMTSYVPGKPGLNLMTATGRYNIRTNQYEKRVVVYTVQD